MSAVPALTAMARASSTTLRVAIPLLLLVTTLVLGLFNWVYFCRQAERDEEQEALQQTTAAVTRLQSRFEYLMAHNDPAEAQRAITALNADPHVQVAWFTDDQDRIVAATQLAWRGTPAGPRYAEFAGPWLAEPVAALLTRARETQSGRTLLSEDGEAVLTFCPVSLPPAPGELRSSRVGLLFVRIDLKERKQAARAAVFGQIAMVSGVLFGASALLWLYFHVVVTRRVERLVTVARALGQGDARARTHFNGRDELSQIGAAFDATAEVLARDAALRVQTQAELKESEDRLKLFVEHSPAAIAMFDNDVRYLVTSRRWLTDYGLGDRSIIGHSHYEIFPEIPERWKAIHRRCLAGAVERCEEDPFVRQDGRTDWVRWEVRPWRHAGGDIGGIIMFTEVVTERKQTQQALIESERRFRAALETMQLVGVMLDRDGNIILCNDFLLKLTGWTREEVLHRSWFDIFLPSDIRDKIKREVFLQAVHTGNAAAHMENEIVTRTGERRLIAWNNTVFRGPDGNVESTASIGEDITNRRRAEIALRESEHRLNIAQRIGAIGSWEWDLKTDAITGSCELYRLLGIDPAGTDTNVFAIIDRAVHPDDRERVRQVAEEVRARGVFTPHEYRVLAPDGTVRWMASQGQTETDARGKAVRLFGVVQDITERRHAEAAVRESEERFRTLFEQATDGVLVLNAEKRFLECNTAACELFGYTREELLALSAPDVVVSTETPRIDPEIARVRAGGSVRSQWQCRRKDGSLFLAEVTAKLLPDGRLQAFGRDVTDIRRAEQKLAESEMLLRTIVDSEPACVKLIGRDGKLMEMNAAGLAMIEAPSREAVVGQSVTPLVVPEHRNAFEGFQRQVLAGVPGVLEFDVVGLKGTRRTLETHAVPLRTPDGGILAALGLTQDITERKRADAERERLMQELTARTAEMESFVYTISHDLKTPLVTIGGFASLIEQDAQAGDTQTVRDSVHEIKKATGALQQHISDLLALSRLGRASAEKEKVSLETLLARVAGGFEATLANQGATLRLAPGLPTIEVDPKGFERVFVNLIDNALKYRRADVTPEIEVGWGKGPNELRLFVRDNGIGIKPEYHERIFRLFERANSKTEGTGVGLTLAKRVVEVHGGRMWVESAPGKGSCFFIGLPLSVMVLPASRTEMEVKPL